MANPFTEARRTNELLFALLAEFMEWHTGINPTAEQVEQNILDRAKADKDTVAKLAKDEGKKGKK